MFNPGYAAEVALINQLQDKLTITAASADPMPPFTWDIGSLKAADVRGPWGYAGPLPESFKKPPADENFKEVKAALPGKKVKPEQAPKAFVSLTPAGWRPNLRQTAPSTPRRRR